MAQSKENLVDEGFRVFLWKQLSLMACLKCAVRFW